MTDKQATPTQEAEPLQPAEAGFSCNMFLSNEVMGRVQFTFRGATSADWGRTLEDIDRFAHFMREKGWKFDGEARVQSAPVCDVPNSEGVLATKEPTRIPLDDSGHEQPVVKVATAGRLSFTNEDGKIRWKILDAVFAAGEKGTKYGLAVYPETLQAAKLDLKEGQPVPDIHGWRVDYVCNEKGYPSKATRLLPPK